MFDYFWNNAAGTDVSKRQQQDDYFWAISIPLKGFRPNEVKIDRTSNNSIIKVHAKRESEDDFCEIKRIIEIPESVGRDELDIDFSQEGQLIFRAPYRRLQGQSGGGSQSLQYPPQSQQAAQLYSTPELRDLNNVLWNLSTQSFPGSLEYNITRGEDGVARVYMDFNFAGYKPEEISVQHEGEYITVEAKHESKTEDGGTSFKHFKRVFSLPKTVNVDQISSRLMSNGRFRLEAPCKIEYPAEQTAQRDYYDIPIQRASQRVVQPEHE
jgi:HSP20 family molecular chaperone IbpA